MFYFSNYGYIFNRIVIMLEKGLAMKRYKCKECGYIHIGDEIPGVCPVCGYDSEVFYEMEDTDKDKTYKYYDMIDSQNDDLLQLIRSTIKDSSDLAGLALAMYVQAEDKEKSYDAELVKDTAFKLLNTSSTLTMFLGEDLDFSTEDNIEILKKRLSKLNTNLEKISDLMRKDYLEDEAEIVDKTLINL